MEGSSYILSTNEVCVVTENEISYYKKGAPKKSKHFHFKDIESIDNEIGKSLVRIRYYKNSKLKKYTMTFKSVEECDNFYMYLQSVVFEKKIACGKEQLDRKESLISPLRILLHIIIYFGMFYGLMYLIDLYIKEIGEASIPIVCMQIIEVLDYLGGKEFFMILGGICLIIVIYGIVRVLNPPNKRKITIRKESLFL